MGCSDCSPHGVLGTQGRRDAIYHVHVAIEALSVTTSMSLSKCSLTPVPVCPPYTLNTESSLSCSPCLMCAAANVHLPVQAKHGQGVRDQPEPQHHVLGLWQPVLAPLIRRLPHRIPHELIVLAEWQDGYTELLRNLYYRQRPPQPPCRGRELGHGRIRSPSPKPGIVWSVRTSAVRW